jgi:TonB-linked SusC/RagA family outer membrane protein
MKKFLLMWFSFGFAISVWAQDRVVTGKVTSTEDGTALPGVNVVVKGTTNGTVTDSDGQYKLTVPGSGTILVFSFIGMTTQEEEVGARSVIDLQMKADVKQLQEVVVNAIGETRERDKLGIASSSVGGGAVVQSGEAGLINGMAGKATGLTITRNGGDPGSGSYIQLRGQSTITGNLQPLIVIDGMPMNNDTFGADNAANQVGGTQQQSRLNDLNPADIASMEILKSAAAAALWGSRAANGVIVITTKKGKNSQGKLNISYSGTVSFDQVNKMPDLQTTYGQGSNGLFSTGTSASYGDLISARKGGADTNVGTAYVQFPDGSTRYAIAPGTGPADTHGGKNSQNTYDHTKDVFQTGHYIDHNITLSSGNDKSQFYASYENLQQQGIIKVRSDYDKNVVRLNIASQLTPKFHVRASANFNNIRSNRAQQGSNTSGILLGMLRTAPDFDNTQYIGTAYDASGIATLGKEITYRNPIGANATPGYDNPFWTINKNTSLSVVNRFIGNMELNYDVNDWLSLKANSGIDTYADRRTDYGNPQSAGYLTGSYTEQYYQNSQFNTNLYANARKKFSDFFKGSILLGFNYNNLQYNNVGATATNFIIPNAPPNLLNSPPSNRTAFNAASTQRTSAGFTEINGEFGDQVFLTATGRAETASTFGPQAQSLFFYPSITGAWQFSKLTGTSDFFSFGKLRGSYGIVGKQPGPYLNLTQFGPQSYFDAYGGTLTAASYGVGGYAISTQAGNPKIKPERKHEVEGGFDLRFFNDRVTLSATAYYNRTTDAILGTQVAPSSGFSTTIANAGIIDNKGAEVSLGVTWLKLQNGFTWNSNLVWFANRNNVVDLAGAQYVFLAGFTDGASVATKGMPLGVIWGTGYAKNANGSYALDGNGFPQVSASTGAIGITQPNYKISLGNTFSYKALSLYVLFDAQVGGQMWNGTQGAMFNFGTTKYSASSTTVSASDAATLKTADGNTIAGLASAGSARVTANSDGTYTFRGTVQNYGGGKVAADQAFYTAAGNGFNVNAPFVQDATWTRLRELTLSYSLNSQAFRNSTKLQSVSFSLTGRNLLLWTPYKGIDPDTNLTGASNGRGLDYFQNPNTRSILFKLTINY